MRDLPATSHPESNISRTPLVSVLMPAYNQARYIEDALESLLHQTYANWEVAIVDDGSPDDVAGIAQKYADADPRISFYHTGNHGVAAARNFAASKTSGELILPLDADDTFEPRYMELCVEKFLENPETKLVYCRWNMFGAVTKTTPLEYRGFADMLVANTIFSAAMYKREDFDRIGGYDTEIPFGFEDWDFWISLLDEESLVCQIPLPLFNYRIKDASRSTSVNAEENQRITREYIYRKHSSKYNSIHSDYISILQRLTYLENRSEKWKRRSLPSRLWHAIKGTI